MTRTAAPRTAVLAAWPERSECLVGSRRARCPATPAARCTGRRVSYVTEGVVRESLRMAEYCRRAPKISVAVVGAVMRPLMAA